MRVLAIDTAGPVIGVALRVGDEVLTRTERVQRGSEALLVPWALALAAEAGTRLDALDGIAVARGPGAFTGLRVGLATACGLALALRVPLWTADSLAPRAARASAPRVLALLDARKGRVYAGFYESGAQVGALGDVPPQEAVLREAPFVATGEGALVYRDLVLAAGGALATDAWHPAVDVLSALAVAGLARGEHTDAAAVAPLYLREADAVPPRDLEERRG